MQDGDGEFLAHTEWHASRSKHLNTRRNSEEVFATLADILAETTGDTLGDILGDFKERGTSRFLGSHSCIGESNRHGDTLDHMQAEALKKTLAITLDYVMAKHLRQTG